MKISKTRIRKMLHELHADPSIQSSAQVVPTEDDYDKVRSLLDGNPEMVAQALNMVMTAAGATCPISTRQAIVDHLQDQLTPTQELEPEVNIGIPVGTVMAEARAKSKLKQTIRESIRQSYKRMKKSKVRISSSQLKNIIAEAVTLSESTVSGRFQGNWAEERAQPMGDAHVETIKGELAGDMIDHLVELGPTDTLELLKLFDGTGWSREELFEVVDLLIDDARVVFDDDGTLWLDPEHATEYNAKYGEY